MIAFIKRYIVIKINKDIFWPFPHGNARAMRASSQTTAKMTICRNKKVMRGLKNEKNEREGGKYL